MRPVDWEAIRYWGDDPSVYRVGIRAGAELNEQLPISEGLEYLLTQAEQQQRPIKDTASGAPMGADKRVVDYWLYHAQQGARIDSSLPRVQAAWFRFAEQAKKQPESLRNLLLSQAREQVAPLKLDPKKAEAALRPAQ